MKPLLYAYMIIILVVSACSSGKSTFERGNYYEAVITSVSRLRRNSDHKKSVETLRQAYPMAVAFYEDRAKTSLASAEPFKWTEVVKSYTTINVMYDEIKRCPGALAVIPNPVNYASKLQEARLNAAEEHYVAGITALQSANREDAKKAYRLFQTANDYVPGYKEVNSYLEAALSAATVKILVEPIPVHSKSVGVSAEFFNDKISEFVHTAAISEFVRFYTRAEAEKTKVKPDHIIQLEFDDFTIGQVYKQEKEIQLTKDSIVMGTYVTATAPSGGTTPLATAAAPVAASRQTPVTTTSGISTRPTPSPAPTGGNTNPAPQPVTAPKPATNTTPVTTTTPATSTSPVTVNHPATTTPSSTTASDAERLAKEQAAKAQAERERVAREQAERERLAREQAERERLAREQAERDRLAREQAERERVAREQQAKVLAEQQAAERAAAEERARLAREAAAKAERDRLEKEHAEKEAAERAKAEEEKSRKPQTGKPGYEDPTIRKEDTLNVTDPVTICHIPPGNKMNSRTLVINRSALKAHLDHGDVQGRCESDSREDKGSGADKPGNGNKPANKSSEGNDGGKEGNKNNNNKNNGPARKGTSRVGDAEQNRSFLVSTNPVLFASANEDAAAFVRYLPEIEGDTNKVYGTVKATLYHFKKTTTSKGIVSLRIIDAKTGALLTAEKLPGEYVWTSEWATFNGDERALSAEQLRLTRLKEQPAPASQDLFIEFTKPIYDQITSKLRDFYKNY